MVSSCRLSRNRVPRTARFSRLLPEEKLTALQEIRKERGIRQEELAKALGVSRQTISSLETGRYNPSIFLAYKIARYFGMMIEDVFLFEEGKEVISWT